MTSLRARVVRYAAFTQALGRGHTITTSDASSTARASLFSAPSTIAVNRRGRVPCDGFRRYQAYSGHPEVVAYQGPLYDDRIRHESLAVASRRAFEKLVPGEDLSIAGVSFDNRQDAVKGLLPGQGVMLVKEPTNPYDQNAISIETLSGESLGYVPASLTHLFPHECIFGRVLSRGPSKSGLYGAVIGVHPSLPSITLQQLPQQLWHFTALQTYLPLPSLQRLQDQLIAQSGYRCEVTGLTSNDSQLAITPVWRFDWDCQVIRLLRCMTVCREVYIAERVLDPGMPEQERASAQSLLQQVNSLGAQDTSLYIQYVTNCQRRTTESEGWQVDLAWLDSVR